jgi:hypothetical protein
MCASPNPAFERTRRSAQFFLAGRRWRRAAQLGRWSTVRRQLFHFFAYTAVTTVSVFALADAVVPNDARKIIQQVHIASSNGDFAALRQLMARDFQWSFGGDRDADQAIEAWKAEAKYLRNMKRVTAQPCGFRTAEVIECPAKAGIKFRAGFEKTRAGWRMHYFVEGD